MGYALVKLAHLAAVIVWVGGMVFAHFFLRPSLALLEPPQDGHARLRFAVTDSGIGMTPAQQARLFQAFEQVSDDSRHIGGTGLGLSISQQLVRLMGSQIQVQSTAGQGSSFSFELRLALA